MENKQAIQINKNLMINNIVAQLQFETNKNFGVMHNNIEL